jgi:hypothetical protein
LFGLEKETEQPTLVAEKLQPEGFDSV